MFLQLTFISISLKHSLIFANTILQYRVISESWQRQAKDTTKV